MSQTDNQEQQLALPSQQGQISVINEREIVEKEIETRAKSMGELNKRLLTEVYTICNGNNRDKNEIQFCENIRKSFRKTDSIKDTLYNINQLIPREKDLKESFQDRKLFIKMDENCQNLYVINIELEQIFSNMEDSMLSYKQKLTSLIDLLKGQHEVKSDLGAFIDKYCVQFATEFDKVKSQENQILGIKNKIQEMRKQEEMAKLGNISKGVLDFGLISVFSNQNSKVQGALKQMQTTWVNKIQSSQQEQEEQFRKTKELEIQISKLEDELNFLNKEKINLDNYEADLLEAINNKKKEKMNEDFAKLQQDQLEILNTKKREALDKLVKLDLEKQKDYQNWSNKIIEQIEQSQKFGNSYNIIFLVDDSGSMHSKSQKGLWKFLQKTPYQILSESIYQFIKKRKHISKLEDIVTIVKFSDNSYTLCRREKIDNIKVNLNDQPLQGGTNFNEAFKEVAENMKLQSKDKSSILIFQTDGQSYQTDQCQNYIQKMMDLDPNFRMFTLALGEDINEEFLLKITKFANKDQEVLNFGKQNPVSFYQKIKEPDSLIKIFDDIQLGIDEQLSNIMSQMRVNQLQLESKQRLHKEEMENTQKNFEEQQQMLEEQIKKTKELKTNEDRMNYLKQQIEEIQKNKHQLKNQMHDMKIKIEENKKKLINENETLVSFEKGVKDVLEKAKQKIEEAQQLAFKEIEKDEDYIKEKIKCFEEIGERSEAKLMLWTQSIHSFDRYMELISDFITKLNRFFSKFRSISNDLQEKIDAYSTTSSSDFKFETQQEIITSEYTDLTYEQIFKEIFEKQYKGPQNEDQQVYEEAMVLILKNFRNMHEFLKGMDFNNPKIKLPSSKKSKNDDESEDEENSETACSKMLAQLKEEQENDLCEIKDTLSKEAKSFLTLKVFDKKLLNSVKKKKDISKIMEKIDEFEFPDEEEDSEEEDQEDESDDGDGDDDDDCSDGENTNKSNKSQQTKQKAKKQPKKKQSSKKKKKQLVLTEEQVQELKGKLKKSLLEKIKQIQRNKQLQDAVKQLYDAFDSKFVDILQSHTKAKKTEQIKSICEYIQKDIIKPLDELMNFQNSPSSKPNEGS